MTRAARHAQRAGAAALSFNLRSACDNLRHASVCFDCSFFLLRTPARWEQRRLWRGAGRTGSMVPPGPGGRTDNLLISGGSVVLFRSPSRDARTGGRACACGDMPQNHRTIEPREGKRCLSTGRRFLARFCGSGAIKLGGVYSLASLPAASKRDPHLNRGGARRNFRASNARRRVQLDDVAAIGRASENGRFLPFFGSAIGHVGTGMSERGAIILADQRVAASSRKLARLRASVGQVGLAAPGGSLLTPIAPATPTPPSRASWTFRMLPQTFSCGSIDLLNRCATGGAGNREGRLTFRPEMGSGEHSHRRRRSTDARCADRTMDGRVGDGGVPFAAKHRDPTGLWAGGDHVNG